VSTVDVLVLGAAYCDVVFDGLEGLPALGRERFSKNLSLHAGGSAITAIALAKLGVRTGLVANVGYDLHGERIMHDLEDSGVHANWLVRDERTTPVTVVLPLANDRAFVTYAPEAPLLHVDAALRSSGARHLHVAGAMTLLDDPTLLERAHSVGVTTSFDPGWHDEALRNPVVRGAARSCTILLPNRSEARELAGLPQEDEEIDDAGARDALHALAANRSRGITVVKDGARGAQAIDATHPTHTVHVSVPPRPVVDATGAGDVFDAGFLRAWLDGRPLDVALHEGAMAGALAVTALGGATAAPTRERLDDERNAL